MVMVCILYSHNSLYSIFTNKKCIITDITCVHILKQKMTHPTTYMYVYLLNLLKKFFLAFTKPK